jgi:hypothetical protein
LILLPPLLEGNGSKFGHNIFPQIYKPFMQ